jgi:DNA (cytosine-5)-methyltransferase 1
MRVGSVFAGIGGFDLAFQRAGYLISWQIEIDRFCMRVLERRFPGVTRLTDVRKVKGGDLSPVDLVCGGFPCQDVSVAGKRAGLDGRHSSLWWELHRLISELRPTWVVVENVCGLLSSRRGRDMGTVLRSLGDLGYWWAYRVLDAQWFGLPQRRKRVFIVGHLGDRFAPVEVLLEPEGRAGDSTPGGTKGQEVTGTAAGAPGGCRESEHTIVYMPRVADTVTAHYSKDHATAGKDSCVRNVVAGLVPGFYSPHTRFPTLRGFGHGWQGRHWDDAARAMLLRRLTPLECERLQGFPDGWTCLCEAMGNTATCTCPDSPRYRALGNAVAVPVVEWIAKRIVAVAGRSDR